MKLLRNKKYIALYILPVFIIIVIFYPNATASVNSYPTEGWQITTPEQQGIPADVSGRIFLQGQQMCLSGRSPHAGP
jgi:hypothetical protein